MSSGLQDKYHEMIEKDIMRNIGNKEQYDSSIILEDGLPYALGIDNEAEVKFNRKK